jgi:hypothetical protein
MSTCEIRHVNYECVTAARASGYEPRLKCQ